MPSPAMPALFVSHGAPLLAVDDGPAHRFLKALAPALPKPRAVLVISAHWESAVPRVASAPYPRTIHDFAGFPRALHEWSYSAPGAPQLAKRVVELVPGAIADSQRGLDHGAWVPLSLIYPTAELPVTQVTVPTPLGTHGAFALGRALAPLRDEGVLIIGSGSLTHSLPERAAHQDAPPPAWVSGFADWVAERLTAGDGAALLHYRTAGPQGRRNHPTEEHFLPLLTVLGTAPDGVVARPLHRGYTYGTLAMDCYLVNGTTA